MAQNVTNPTMLTIPGGYTHVETVLSSAAVSAGVLLTRAGALPGAIGAYVAGPVTKAVDGPGKAVGIATIGYAVVRLAPGAVVPVDAPIAADAAGLGIPATGTNYVVGRAVDSSTGGGTAQNPHFIVVKLS